MAEHKKTVCVDLDATLADYSKGWNGIGWAAIGKPCDGAQDFVRELLKMADHVKVHTTRTNTMPNKGFSQIELVGHIARYLRENDFPKDLLIAVEPGKPSAAAYVDDRAVVCRPMEVDPAIAYKNALLATKILLSG